MNLNLNVKERKYNITRANNVTLIFHNKNDEFLRH